MGNRTTLFLRFGMYAVMAAGFLHACGSTDANKIGSLSYDPSLKPGQPLFNPEAPWVEAWQNTPPPANPVPSTTTVEDVIQDQKTQGIAWNVIKGGQVETLPAGVKPAEVLVADPKEIRRSRQLASAKQKTQRLARAETSTSRKPASERSKDATAKPISVATDFPLDNSLAVESLRLKKYSKTHSYNWEVPVAAKEAFESKGRLMNAFFFVRRRGENWQNLSRMVYGNKSRAEEMRRWNGDKPLKVGTILYYESPNRPGSKHMMPIASDFGQRFMKIRTVKKEPLTLFGKRIYGEWRTWKEIAYFNSIDNPHWVRSRKPLRLQPRLLGHLRRKHLPKGDVRIPAASPSNSQ